MVEAVEIILKNGIREKDYLFVYKNNSCYLNNKKYQIKEEQKEKLLTIISSWENEYGSTNDIDIQEFSIKVITKEKVDIFHGKGIYPTNYNELIELLGDIDGNSR